MTRFSIIFIYLLCYYCANSQNVKVIGKVFERDSISTLPFAFVVNKNTSTGRVTDENGRYEINCSITDTLIFTYTGRIPTKIYLIDYVSKTSPPLLAINIYLFPKDVKLKEFVVRSYDFSKEERQNYERYINRTPPTIMSPISALYYEFSRRERSIRKLAELYTGLLQEEIAKSRLPDSKIREITGNPKLTFELLQQFCPMSYSYISTALEYDLYLSIKKCYKYYQSGY